MIHDDPTLNDPRLERLLNILCGEMDYHNGELHISRTKLLETFNNYDIR